jgi:hypothetical protein
MIEPIKKTIGNASKLKENKEVRAIGRAASRAAVRAAREFVKAFPQEYNKERSNR